MNYHTRLSFYHNISSYLPQIINNSIIKYIQDPIRSVLNSHHLLKIEGFDLPNN